MTIKEKTIRVNLQPYWDNKLNNQEIADKLNIHVNTVSAYKNGNIKNPKIEVLLKFRDFLSELHGKKLILEDLIVYE